MALYEITSETVPLDFECTVVSDPITRTIQNCKNLIMCRRGEVPFDRQRGLDPAVFELPYYEANAAIVPELDRCLLWEPDAEVYDGWLELRKGETIVHCVVEIKIGEEDEGI